MSVLRLTLFVAIAASSMLLFGCRSRQQAHVLKSDDKDMVGSHTAGAETWQPLVEESVARLMGRSATTIHQASHVTISNDTACPTRTVCFVGVENRSGEELGDFREQIYEEIDSLVSQHDQFRMISRRYVEAAMSECRCNPGSLFLPENQRQLQVALERVDQPFDYLMIATITSGTTTSNSDYQRNYTLTLELINIHTGDAIKENAKLRKGYHKSFLGKLRHYND